VLLSLQCLENVIANCHIERDIEGEKQKIRQSPQGFIQGPLGEIFLPNFGNSPKNFRTAFIFMWL